MVEFLIVSHILLAITMPPQTICYINTASYKHSHVYTL